MSDLLAGRGRRSRRSRGRANGASPAALAAAGPRAAGRREEYELLVEAIYEGYLLHYGAPRVIARPRPTCALLAGRPAVRDRPRAAGRARRHGGGRRAGRHDHAQRARPGRRRARARRGRVGGRRARPSAGARARSTGGPRSSCSPALRRRSRRCAQAGERADLPAHALNRASILFGLQWPTSTSKHKSKYTADRGIPGAFEGETITRRRFMTGTRQRARARSPPRAFTLPALGFALGPIFKSTPHRWETVGPTSDFTEDNYVPVILTLDPGIGEAGKTTVYVRKFNADDRHRPIRPGHAVHRDLDALRAPRLPGALGGCRRALHLPVPRRRLRPARPPRRRPAGAPARPLLHARDARPGRDRPALQRQQRAAALLPARPGRAARRHRPVPLPVASDRPETVEPHRRCRSSQRPRSRSR